MENIVSILIVEDEAIPALHAKVILEDAGYEIVGVVKTGEDAVSNASENHPDIVLMDINLKGDMNGIEVAKIIQQSYGIHSFFLTAYTQEEVLRKNPGLRHSDVMTKPIQLAELKTRIEHALQEKRTT